MILETGRIVAIESEGVWVETIQRSTCGTCRAEKGCGQRLMAKWSGHTAYIWVLLEGRNPASYQIGDEITLGIPEDVIAKGAMVVYLVPLFTLLIATVFAHQLFANEAITTLSAFFGLAVGGLILRWHAHRTRFDSRLQPVVVDDRAPLHFFEPAGQR